MKINKIVVAISLLTIVGTLIVYPALPDVVPTHWNMYGEIDGYGPKWMSILLACLPALMYGLFFILPKIDPKHKSFSKFSKAYERIMVLLILFFVLVQIITILAALGYELPIDLIVKVGLAVLFLVLGNYLGQVKPNYTFGIRTPWTLANEKVWIKTHRMTSYLMVLSALIMLICAFIPGSVGFILYFICIFAPIVFSIIYSFYSYKQQ